MKIIVIGTILFAILGLALCEGPIDDALAAGKECPAQFKTKAEDLREAFDGKMKPADVPENIKCTVKCYLEKSGAMDAQGVFKPAVVIARAGDTLPVTLLEKIVAPCKDLKGSSTCDTAFQISTCLWKMAKDKQ